MSYLQDKRIKHKKYLKIALSVFIFLILFYFRSGIFNGLSYVTGGLFRPVLIVGGNIGEKFRSFGAYFISKSSLYKENEDLKSQINESVADRANYAAVVDENIKLKEILGRKNEGTVMTLASIISKPNQSLYDTLVIDAGEAEGIKEGSMVFAFGDIPIGRVSIVYPHSSKIVLFSSSGERTQAFIGSKSSPDDKSGDLLLELVGRGGGNFEMIIPRDLILQKGDLAVWPGMHTYPLAIFETVISDPRDPLTKALFVSPVNIQELKFVQIAK